MSKAFNSREIVVVVLAVDEQRLIGVSNEGQRRARIGSMADRSADLVQVLLAGNHSPLIARMVADHSGVGKVGLEQK